jgi:hypothetical protein
VKLRVLCGEKSLCVYPVPAYTFDNVRGKFPIGFKIWNTSKKEVFRKTLSDVFDEKGNKIGTKKYYSYYDIREFFQGRNENGKMNNTSTDEIYTGIIQNLRNNLSLLAGKIELRIYEYGFLK